ncbi:MAG: Asp-tRNA(Asn)/Glu-tRNA(Gln) amidotransferase subunit GatA [Candidatus Adiutrix sp.]|jgi:aspartyl-tRNA(Asn)/glutamyl-tRNA(Gln) amidotransferase subunit A|nr:Asp-tRNA(Asn)/Glu-tRNA(Gln) amidotransferase subunit GatA [Candidatus Adiutrix sp.]
MTELHKLTLTEAARLLQNREISAAEMVGASLARIEATEPLFKACLTVAGDQALAEARGLDRAGPDPAKPLWGLPLTVKDVFLTKGLRTTAASRYLENYIPAYDARVVERLREAGAVIVAKTNLDEFAMGVSTEFSAFGPTFNPWNPAKVPGGSSGGAAASVAAYQVPGGFGTDTGGSLRQPACLCGCVGLKPTYGRVSRYGIVPVAGSLDQAGPLARRVRDCACLLAAVAGPDERDAISSLHPVEDYAAAVARPLAGLKLGLPRELWSAVHDSEVKAVLEATIRTLEGAGARLAELSLPSLKYAVAVYNILASAEASTNLARYDGVRYGCRAEGSGSLTELYVSSRSRFLGPEVRRRIILGTFVLSSGCYEAYFQKAARVRRLIRDDYLKAMADCDFLLTPVSPFPAWDLGSFIKDPVTAYGLDFMTLPVNLAGLPALAVPAGLGPSNGLPVGLQLIGRPFEEKELISAGLAWEEAFPPLL